jgi:hypothetical protein
MKKLALLLSFVSVASFAGAQDAAKPAAAATVETASKPAAKAEKAEKAALQPAGKTHEVAAEAVSVDVDKKTLTIKGEKENTTVPVDEKAVASLKDVKAGDKLTLTCWDDAKGVHQKVTAIAKAPAKK